MFYFPKPPWSHSASKKKPSQVHLLSRRAKLQANEHNSVWESLPTVQPNPFAKAINYASKFNTQPKKAADWNPSQIENTYKKKEQK